MEDMDGKALRGRVPWWSPPVRRRQWERASL